MTLPLFGGVGRRSARGHSRLRRHLLELGRELESSLRPDAFKHAREPDRVDQWLRMRAGLELLDPLPDDRERVDLVRLLVSTEPTDACGFLDESRARARQPTGAA